MVAHQSPLRRSPSSSVRLSAISSTTPSCVSPQDAIGEFSKRKVDYGGYRLRIFRMWSLTAQWRACGHRACYIGVPLYVCGFVVLGVALKEHKSIPALVIGWGLLVVAVMMNTVAVCASLYVRTTREDSSLIFFFARCLYQRLLPKTPGRD